MTKDEYWQEFLMTGCIADYLAYAQACSRDAEQERYSGEDFSNTYAGFSMCNRDDSQIRTNR